MYKFELPGLAVLAAALAVYSLDYDELAFAALFTVASVLAAVAAAQRRNRPGAA